MRTEVIRLIQCTPIIDKYGDTAQMEFDREVFATPRSVGMKEFYQAASTGLKPELKFVLEDYLDYHGEEVIVYDDVRYRVLRTYRDGNRLELTVYREVNPG